MAHCSSKYLTEANPDYQRVRSWYDDSAEWYEVVEDLQRYREKNDKSADYFPSEDEREKYMSFVAHMKKINDRRNKRLIRRLNSKPLRETGEVYKDMLKLKYTRNQLESRLNLIKMNFSNQIRFITDKVMKEENIELSIPAAIRRLGGYQKALERVFNKLAKSTVDSEYEYLVKAYGEPKNDAEKKVYRDRAEYITKEMHKVADNKERFATLATREIASSFGLVIDHNGIEMSLKNYHDVEDEEDKQKDDTGGSGGDRYIDVRVKKIMETISTETKAFLSSIPMIDNARKVVRDDLLRPRCLDPKQIAYVLPSILRFSTSESMMSDLHDASDRFPFLTSLVNKLEKDKNYQALIYTNFKRAANLYGYVDLYKGSYRANRANTRAQGNALVRSASINMGGTRLDPKWSIYDDGGLLSRKIKDISSEVIDSLNDIKNKLGFVNTTTSGFDHRTSFNKKGEPTHHKDYTEYSKIAQQKGGAEALRKFLEDNQNCVSVITRAARGLGIDLSEYQVYNAILSPINNTTAKILGQTNEDSHKGTNRLSSIIDELISVYDEAARPEKKGSDKFKHKTARDVANVVSKEFTKLNAAFAVSFFDELEPRVLVENTSLQTYVYPNLIHDTMDALNNEAQLDEKEYNEFLDREYLRFEDMTLEGKPTGWLKRLRDGSAFNYAGKEGNQAGPFKLVHMTAFNHVEYENLSIPQKICAQLVMWGSMNRAVECPIQADYANAWDFIQNAGIESGSSSAELDDVAEQRAQEEFAKFENINDRKPTLNEKTVIRERVANQVIASYGNLRRPDGTYNTQWPVVQDIADEVMIEINRISRLRTELAEDPNGLESPRMRVYDTQGLKFQIFPELNDNGFYDKYFNIKSDVEARDFVENQVAEQLYKRIQKDQKYLEKTKALTNPMLDNFSLDRRQISLYSPTGLVKDLSSGTAVITLQNFFLDYYYGRIQMVKLMNGGLQQFKGLLDFEKRNMMNHATRRPVYTEAYWNGELVGRKNQNAVYLEDDISESDSYSDISEMLGTLKDLGYIDDAHREKMTAAHEEYNSTDGQAFRYYPSYRVTQIELGKWDDARERVYNYLMYDKGMASKEEIAQEMQRVYNTNEKPVYTGWEIVNNVKVPVLHKYAETILFPEKVLRKLMGNEIPSQILAMSRAAEKLDTKKRPFDIFLFHSCVKVGAHTLLDPFGFETDEKGKRILDENGKPIRKYASVDQMTDHIVNSITQSPWAVHELPMKYYGEAASTPAHGEDDEISWSSQAQKDLWGNIEADDEIRINGESMKASEARDLDDEIDAATATAMYKEVQEIFDDPEELRDVLKNELTGKSYSSPELEFALNSGKVPYFYPSIARGAEQLFSSIIKKRMTRPKTKGANLLQVTSLGFDVDPFGRTFGLSKNRKLRIVFDGEGINKRIKYIECYMPIHDSRLEIFADDNGEITPERLQDLLDKKIIPDDLINFVAYRTPSDDIHSIIPLRVKGFTSKARGANIMVPKEVMKMTGHDFDGDKLRCHFQDFEISVDDNKLYETFLDEQAKDENIVKGVLGEDNAATQKYNQWKKEWLKNSDNYEAGMIRMYQYDYSKKAWENSQEQRDNAKVQLAFAQLTSPAGSRRMLIPGGSADTDVYGATFHITRALHDDKSLANKLGGFGINFNDDVTIYKSLRKLDGKTLSKIMDIVNGNVVPFSFEHSNEAFDYMMGGKKMISVYALYASAGQMLQRLGLKVNQGFYKDSKTKETKQYKIGFFGKTIDNLYKIVNNVGQLGSLTQSEMINSAVDNGKNPRLGYLNQDPKLAEITNYLVAANIGAEQVHLILNQPVIMETVRRMKDQSISFKNAMSQIKDELTTSQNLKQAGYLKKASDTILNLPEDDWIGMMPISYDEVKANKDEIRTGRQIALLSVLLNQNKYSMLLSKFIKGTRPEATSNGIGSVLAKTMVINSELEDLRRRIINNELDQEDIIENEEEQADKADNEKDEPVKQPNLIDGLADIITPIQVLDNDGPQEISDKLSKSKIKRVTALEALMQDKVFRFFAPYFPQAKEQWRRVMDNIVSRYDASQREKEAIYRNVGNEMILWTLLKSSAFSADVKADGYDMVVNFPKRFTDFQTRVKQEKYRKERGEDAQDAAARSLIDNVFIEKLSVDEPQGESEKPRLFFQKGGVTMDDYAEKITYDWAMMSVSPYEEVRQMALDLFKYNAFASGFGYGMYEFSHFAPFTVLEQVTGYLESLNAMRDNALFTDSAKDATNFLLQYYANHWGDTRLVKRFKPSELPNEVREMLGMKPQSKEKDAAARKIFGSLSDHIMFTVEGKNEIKLIYPVLNDDGSPKELINVPKTGHRTKRNQVNVQFNPHEDFDKIEPYQAGLDSAWGDFGASKIQNSEASNIEEDTMTEAERAELSNSITADDYAKPVMHYGEAVEAEADMVMQFIAQSEKNVAKTEAALAKQKQKTSKYTSKDKINIWFSSGENAELSNLAIRPFRFEAESPYNNGEETIPLTMGEITFQSVEHAFQYLKVTLGAEEEYRGDHYRKNVDWDTARKILNAKTGYEARKLGRSAKHVNSAYWDSISSRTMEDLIRESFKQNPDALRKLLDTGNATLTHTQDSGKWGTEFPRILMKVRSEFAEQLSKASEEPTTTEAAISAMEGDMESAIAQRMREGKSQPQTQSDSTFQPFYGEGEIASAEENYSAADRSAFSSFEEEEAAYYANQKQPKAQLLFVESSSSSYPERTRKNAKADATIAFALDFNTAGERLTKKSVLEQGKKYIPINLNGLKVTDEIVDSIISELNSAKAKTLNIAGNGIYTLKGKYTQKQIDDYVYEVLRRVITDSRLNTQISSIRSGGQTGVDEAGVKAGVRLGIQSGVLAPKGWLYRDINGKDISNEASFKARFDSVSSMQDRSKNYGPQNGKMPYLSRVEVDENGVKHVVTKTANWTPDVVRQSREQKAYVALNKLLREKIFPKLGVATTALTNADARLGVQGITDFSKATQVNAYGLYELIRLEEGYKGMEALPEEFGHLALEMLGHDHHLVKRLLNELERNERAMKEAFEGQYEEYKELYKDDMDKLRLEAAGKLVAKSLLRNIPIETPETKPLIRRIIDKIKEILHRISSWEVFEAIMDANQLSSRLARDLISGRILDDMKIENISRSDSFAKVQKNVDEKLNVIERIKRREEKRLALLKKRVGPISKEQKTDAMIATEKQIAILEDAIRNHKVESALLDYLKNSLQFLKDTEAALDQKVLYGDKVNTICRELNKVRDTIYSYASVIKLLNDAIEAGEVIESADLTRIKKDVKDQMDKFMTKYEHLGMRFFERMLANVYGEHGVTRTLGKDRGKVLTIEEMARRGDRDISGMTRLFSSLADCGDYVLAAFDDITRRAKIAGRQRADEAHRRVLVAWEKLVRETGSKDQSFMFEMKLGEDGKMHKTGEYITEEEAKNLPKAKYEFYKEIMAIKHDIDECLPPVCIKSPYNIVALRKIGMDRVKDAEGMRGKLGAFGENMKNAILDNSDEADKEERSMQADFQGNKIDALPIKYTTKGKHESWDDMTDDVALSIVAYASMGYEYDELNQVIAMLENARYMSMNREIQQKSGWQRLVERVRVKNGEEEFGYDEPFTKKQMYTNLQRALDDFFQMHLYGKLEKEEGGLLGTRVSARKAANLVNAAASYTQMAFNLQQRISNVGAGMMNIGVETAGKGAFNAAGFAWATKVYMKHAGKRILETGALASDDKLSLFAERYDLHQNNGKFNPKESFNKSRFSRTFNTNLLFAGLNMGEDFLALTTALAIAHNTKVRNTKTGKVETLWDAFDVEYADGTKQTSDNRGKPGAHLILNPAYVMEDGSAIDRAAEEKFAKLVIGTNFRLQGIYNSDDKSAIQQYAFGSLVMMYRKWMHPAIVRRYGKAGYNPLTGQEGEGYWRTVANWVGESFKETLTDEEGNRIAMNIIDRVKQTFSNLQLNKSKMTDYEKSNLSRALVEASVLLGVCLALMLHSKFAPDKDEKDKELSGWFDSMAVYQLFRLRNEIGSVAPSPLIFKEITNTLSSPIAAIEPMRRLLRIPYLLWPGTWKSEVKSGAFKGKSKAEKIIFELPVLSLYKQINHLVDPTPLINYYKNDLTF